MVKRDFTGKPETAGVYLQRFTVRKKIEDSPDEASALAALPKKQLNAELASRLPDFLKASDITCHTVDKENVLWAGTDEGLWRINESEPEPLDRIQCFRASAYMLDNEVRAVESDGKCGVRVLTRTSVSHIEMRPMTLKEKAIMISELNRRLIQRRGMLSGGTWDKKNKSFKGKESDNDGLWTALVAMGDLCRYAVLRDDPSSSPQEVELARLTATRWTEAVLLLACIPGFKGMVPAYVRYNKPGTNRASREYLKEGREGRINMPEYGPAGIVTAPLGPENPDDWTTCGMPEIVFRNIEGFIARSYHVNDEENDPTPFDEGMFYRKLYDPEHRLISVLIPSRPDIGDDSPMYIDSSLEIPERLRRLYTSQTNPKTGKPWGDDDIIFKCDTSNDELVGHYAVWQLAYDILGGEDEELAQIIRTVAARHAKHFTDNGYAHTDGGGQPTSWARMTREYYMNSCGDAFCDAPLGTLILLQLYKVAHHVTGDAQWDEQYRKLALEEPYRYADLAAEHYKRYAIAARTLVDDEDDEGEVFRQVVKIMNYSDIRMAAVAYYTLAQLETDPVLIKKYRAGADSWWKLEKYSRDVEWMLIYQLINNEAKQLDGFGRSCAEILRWQLSHFPLNLREFRIDNTSRPDIVEEDGCLWYGGTGIPCALAMDERGSTGSSFFDSVQGRTPERRDLGNGYNMIMPYWIARYHGILRDDGEACNSINFEEYVHMLEQE
ncbi:MAG: hypothetical protein GX051_10325 [Clostridiales bacterium]|nr:hypothetical protein [Clostridiales bacterium]